MTDNDLRLLANVLRLSRSLADDVENWWEGGDLPNGKPLLDALDQFKFKGSFQVPE